MIPDKHGNVYLQDRNGDKHLAFKIKEGVSCNFRKTKPRLVIKVSVLAYKGFGDDFFFSSRNKFLFHNIQTHFFDNILTHLYLEYLADKKYSPRSFVEYMVKYYFRPRGLDFPTEKKAKKSARFIAKTGD